MRIRYWSIRSGNHRDQIKALIWQINDIRALKFYLDLNILSVSFLQTDLGYGIKFPGQIRLLSPRQLWNKRYMIFFMLIKLIG